MWFRRRKRACCTTECPGNPVDCTSSDCAVAMPLDMVENGATVTIQSISGRGPIPRRLMEMGFLRGTTVTVLRRAPLNDPIEFEIRGYLVSLRREEAHLILVVPTPQEQLHPLDTAEQTVI